MLAALPSVRHGKDISISWQAAFDKFEPSLERSNLADFPGAGGTEPCDDGNLYNGDGCNEFCEIEQGYVCEPGSAEGPSVCDAICGDLRWHKPLVTTSKRMKKQ